MRPFIPPIKGIQEKYHGVYDRDLLILLHERLDRIEKQLGEVQRKSYIEEAEINLITRRVVHKNYGVGRHKLETLVHTED